MTCFTPRIVTALILALGISAGSSSSWGALSIGYDTTFSPYSGPGSLCPGGVCSGSATSEADPLIAQWGPFGSDYLIGNPYAGAAYTGLYVGSGFKFSLDSGIPFTDNAVVTNSAYSSLTDRINFGSNQGVGSTIDVALTFSLETTGEAYWIDSNGVQTPLETQFSQASDCAGTTELLCAYAFNSVRLTVTNAVTGEYLALGSLYDGSRLNYYKNQLSLTLNFTVHAGDTISMNEYLQQDSNLFVGSSRQDISEAWVRSYAFDPILLEVLTPGAYYTSESGTRYGESGLQNVPEPSTLALIGLGLAGFALRRRRSTK